MTNAFARYDGKTPVAFATVSTCFLSCPWQFYTLIYILFGSYFVSWFAFLSPLSVVSKFASGFYLPLDSVFESLPRTFPRFIPFLLLTFLHFVTCSLQMPETPVLSWSNRQNINENRRGSEIISTLRPRLPCQRWISFFSFLIRAQGSSKGGYWFNEFVLKEDLRLQQCTYAVSEHLVLNTHWIK